MTRTGQDAIDWAYSRVGNGPPPPNGMPDDGLCLQFTRECFAVPALYASAIDAWETNPEQHPGDRYPPPAVPVWFWSSSPYRHIAFHAGGGQVITTFNDDVRVYPSLAAMEPVFGGYMGWSPQVNTVTVYDPPEDDVSFTDADRNLLENTNALLQETPFRAAQQVHYWQVSRTEGAPTTFLQDQTDGVTNTYALLGGPSSRGAWSPRHVVLFLLAVVMLVLLLVLPYVLTVDDAVRPFLSILAVIAGAIATLAATTRGQTPPAPPAHLHTEPAAREPRDPGTDPRHDLARHPQDRGAHAAGT